MTGGLVEGHTLLQSEQQWDARNRILAESMSALVNRYASQGTGRGLDVGCQKGALTDAMNEATPFSWVGIDPAIDSERRSPRGAALHPGRAAAMPFADASFDAALFANVFEHVLPEERTDSLAEIARVMRAGGVVAGQIPNPYFPIESHSRLPFMGWLPYRAQKLYWRLSPAPWEHDFYVVTLRHLRAAARTAGLELVLTRPFNYPLEVIPERLRPVARLMQAPMRRFPWAWQFVLRRAPG